jgi:hypothetical protein
LAAVAASLVTASVAASSQTNDGTEPITRPSGLGPVRWIVIEENAAKAQSAAAGVDCSKFVLTQQRAAKHLTAARQIDGHDFNHMITWLPCYAGGRVGFTSGRQASWSIREDGAAWLGFDSGEEMYLYCPRCRLPRTGSWMY